MITIQQFSQELFNSGAIQFGNFTLKSGIQSPFYLDVRRLISFPAVLKQVGERIHYEINTTNFDIICGIPYAGISFATTLALETQKPMVMIRKESKNYGTKKIIEGVYKKNDHCLVIEDVITSGQSILETLPNLEEENLKISEVIVLIDREQGGVEVIKNKGYRVKALFNITEILKCLIADKSITDAEYIACLQFIENNQVSEKSVEKNIKPENKVAQKLKEIAQEKHSNLILSLDVENPTKAFEIIEKVGKSIAMLKLHTDCWDYFTEAEAQKLLELKQKHNFLILEDRKFADIGSTMQSQLQSKIFTMLQWADAFTCHSIAGEPSVKALADVLTEKQALILIGSMSSEGTLTDDNYLKKTIQMAENIPQVMGIVSQKALNSKNNLQFTPGVQLETKTDGLGQQYNTPYAIFNDKKADFAIVGRGILNAENPTETAETYRKICWEAKNNL